MAFDFLQRVWSVKYAMIKGLKPIRIERIKTFYKGLQDV
jgi:hypothetical protein